MKTLYNILVGILAFYFVVWIFTPIITFVNPNGFSGVFLAALLFGIVVAAMPSILNFLKIKETTGAIILGGLVFNFIFYFLGYYLIKIFAIADRGSIILIHNSLRITMNDKVLVLVLISLISALVVVAVQTLGKKK